MVPFSLMEEENQGSEMSGRSAAAGIAGGNLLRAGLRSREWDWCCHVITRGTSCHCLAREKK